MKLFIIFASIHKKTIKNEADRNILYRFVEKVFQH